MRFKTLDEAEVRGKTLILRIDANVPVDETGRIAESDRLIEHAKTLRELISRKARVITLAHQGRRGGTDFIGLRQHARLLSKYVGSRVRWVDDIVGERALKAIDELERGEALLLDNVRFLEDETKELPPSEHAKSELVQALAPLADLFVNDAFSVAHRSHASTVGFTAVLPSYAGRVMEKELETIDAILWKMEISEHDTFALGGAKPSDPLDIMDWMFKERRLEVALVGGIVGLLFLKVAGYELGNATEELLEAKGYARLLRDAAKLWKRRSDQIELPRDLAMCTRGRRVELSVEDLPAESQILDIGSQTMRRFGERIKRSIVVGMKGPVGVYERKGFEVGTKAVLDAIATARAISLVGGGHTLDALRKLGIDKQRFTHVSLGGGALIRYLSGKPLPALEALKKA